jgi:error-prone DNA polymerase
MYVELHASSAFSFLAGASSPEALVDRAAELGYSALALLDRDGVYGAPRFHKAARVAGLKPIIGAELTICPDVRIADPDSKRLRPARATGVPNAAPALGWRERVSACGPRGGGAPRELKNERRSASEWGWGPTRIEKSGFVATLPVFVATREGYQNLCRLVTRMKLRSPKGEGALTLDELEGHTRGLVALAGSDLLLGMRLGVGGLLDQMIGLFGRDNVYVELQRHLLRDEEVDLQMLTDLASAFHVPVVATNSVRFATPEERPLFDVLTCIRHKTTLDLAGRKLARNAERYLKSPEEMVRLFHDEPAAVAATRDLADRLQYTMADLGYRFPEYPVPPGETPISFLRKLTDLGARERYRPYHEWARAQVARELDLIEKLDLAGYFLIVWDIINFCRQHDIFVQGRGSAANSAVCYSLGITAVDPVGMDLLFERFLSEERGEWPDIDLDLPSGDRRERVIQHVYEKYGTPGAAPEGPRAAMTANVITYRGRSAAREVGKTLGLEGAEVDRLSKAMTSFEFVDPNDTLAKHLHEAGFDPSEPRLRLFADLWRRMLDLPRHLGQHSGGMVLCHGRLDEVVPLENATMPDRVVVQWDKDDCADMGLIKVDLLGLGMMAVLQDAIAMVNGSGSGLRDRGLGSQSSIASNPQSPTPNPRLDLAHLPQDDSEVYRMLQAADTIGVFQVESRAQMATLPRLRPERFYDIVVQVAIIRPGPIVGQMVHPYLDRRAGRAPVAYAHPSLEPILKRTLGVPLFQEQLLRMAMVTAGFSGGQAEELRRAFGFKRSERRMKQVEVQLREGMARQGISGAAADEIVKSISSFALYGFPESHAASFALLAYASAYLKVHYPAAFYAALLNNQPMGFYHPATLVKDAQRHGVRFAPIDVQQSDWLCTIEEDGRIRLGLTYVSGLREDAGRAIEKAGTRPRESTLERSVFSERGWGPASPKKSRPRCPKCGSEDESMIEIISLGSYFCNTCAFDWTDHPARSEAGCRFSSIEDLASRTTLRREELQTLADIGALNAFGCDRRTALWQVEKAVRPAGELFQEDRIQHEEYRIPNTEYRMVHDAGGDEGPRTAQGPRTKDQGPLPAMSATDRLVADYDRTGLTIGPHPMALRRSDLAVRGVLRAIDLPRARDGRRVRVAGAVITRQRPGTAKGFVFLTLEDETGIANIIVRPDLFDRERTAIVSEPFLLIEGTLQNQEGVTSVKADRVQSLSAGAVEPPSHDFY